MKNSVWAAIDGMGSSRKRDFTKANSDIRDIYTDPNSETTIRDISKGNSSNAQKRYVAELIEDEAYFPINSVQGKLVGILTKKKVIISMLLLLVDPQELPKVFCKMQLIIILELRKHFFKYRTEYALFSASNPSHISS